MFEVSCWRPRPTTSATARAGRGRRLLDRALGASRARERAGQILYIEDNPVNVLLVEELVKTVSGLAIVVGGDRRAPASSGRKTLRPDLVLIDLQLPDFDGFEVLRRLRAEPSTARDPLHRPVGQRDAARTSSAASRPASPTTGPSRSTSSAFLAALKKRFPGVVDGRRR